MNHSCGLFDHTVCGKTTIFRSIVRLAMAEALEVPIISPPHEEKSFFDPNFAFMRWDRPFLRSCHTSVHGKNYESSEYSIKGQETFCGKRKKGYLAVKRETWLERKKKADFFSLVLQMPHTYQVICVPWRRAIWPILTSFPHVRSIRPTENDAVLS